MIRRTCTSTASLFLLGVAGLLVAIATATVTTVWLLWQVRQEQLTVAELLRGGSISPGALQGQRHIGVHWLTELRWEFLFSVFVLLVLLTTAIAVVVMLRAYLVSERLLARVTQLSRNVLASMDQAVLTMDREGRLINFNPCAGEWLGIGERHIGQGLAAVCVELLPLDEIHHEIFQAGQHVHDRDFTVSLHGRPRRMRAGGHLLRDEEGQVAGSVVHVADVTDRHLLEDRMRRMERFIGLGSLAAGLHHEIKNPLSALSLHVQLLEERWDRGGDPEIADSLSVLRREVHRISGVLESFRDFASVENLERAPTDIRATVESVVQLIRPTANRQNVAVEFQLPPEGLPLVPLDGSKFEQVILNLVLNALDEMPQGGNLTLRLLADDRWVQIEVGDTGPGIPEHVRSRVFEPYYTTKSGGSGMGLALSEKIVQIHGGSIDFASSGAGTVFRVAVPREWPVTVPVTGPVFG